MNKIGKVCIFISKTETVSIKVSYGIGLAKSFDFEDCFTDR